MRLTGPDRRSGVAARGRLTGSQRGGRTVRRGHPALDDLLGVVLGLGF
jgi:hypothetical protein